MSHGRWKRTIASILLSVTFFVIAGGLAICLGIWLCSGIKQIVLFLPVVFQDFLLPFLEDAFAWIAETAVATVKVELLFGKVFWDYSAMPFNLGGRINLLYCFFWGIAAVVWIKGIYPKAAWLIGIILKKTRWVLTGILVVFMAFNIFVSVLALVRYDTQADGKTTVYRWEQVMDKYFDDVKMERIYPNAIRQ